MHAKLGGYFDEGLKLDVRLLRLFVPLDRAHRYRIGLSIKVFLSLSHIRGLIPDPEFFPVNFNSRTLPRLRFIPRHLLMS